MAKITFFPISGNGGGGGSVDSVGATAPITSSGGSNPIISTSMNTNKLIGRSSAGSGVMEEITVGDGLELSGGILTNTATPTPLGYYGGWQDNQTQSANANNVGVAMIFREEDLSNGISVVSDGTNLTRITFAHTGIYNLQFSSQFQNIDNAQHDVSIWLRRNGLDVDGSSGFVSVPVRKNPSEYGHIITSWNYLLDVVAGQYYELIWSTTNYQNITMKYYSAGNPPPATASVILTVTQQSGIMGGTGITALNGLTAEAQTFQTGTSGTDFNISSSGSTHTFNIPTASNLARGLVSILAQTFAGIKTFLSAPIFDSLTASQILATNGSKAVQSLDTATYPSLTELSYGKGVTSAIQTQLNSKQATITGGATTIVSANLTGSRALVSNGGGKVDVSGVTTTELGFLGGVTSAIQTQIDGKQATLVSGTNIKSINGDTILGSGNELVFNYDRAKFGFEAFTDFLSAITANNGIDSAYTAFFSGTGASVAIGSLPAVRATNQQGFIQPATGSQATGYAGIYGTTNGNNFFAFGGGVFNFTTSIFIPNLSTVTDRYRIVLGFGTTAVNASDPSGALFTYDEGGIQNGTSASPFWQCVTSVSNVRTLTVTSVLANTSAWQKFDIQINATGTSVDFYIDNVLVATHTTNIPTGISFLVTSKIQIAKSIGTTARSFFADYFGYKQTYTTAKT